MVDLKAIPFYLNGEQITWVEDAIVGMTPEERIGQLFIIFNQSRNPDYIRRVCENHHIGGPRWTGGTLEGTHRQNRLYQEYSRTPLLTAANCETGGNDAVTEGTIVAADAACGVCETTQAAYDTGYVNGVETSTIGCNWNFASVTDMLLDWRNTTMNARYFGDEPDTVVRMTKAYMGGVHRHNIVYRTKHSPEDGSKERDRHLMMGCNDLFYEEWDNVYGKVYRELIDDGLENMMIGHICRPAYTRRLRPDASDKDVIPVTLSPKLSQNLLREQLGLSGLIVTGASHIAGLTCSCPRSEQVPGAITVECGMFLFFHELERDLKYMIDGYRDDVVTEERLSDALHRILGMKAHLGLYHLEFPDRKGLDIVGCGAYHQYAVRAIEEAVTLAKDTQKTLLIDLEERKRVKLCYIESEPVNTLDGADAFKHIMVEGLGKVGFKVMLHENFYEVERNHPFPRNRGLIRACESVRELRTRYDLAMVFVHIESYAQGNIMRAHWSVGHSNEIPWYSADVPTVCVSLNYTDRLYKLPMFWTLINAYCSTREYIHATVIEITGKPEFKGHYNDAVWCGRQDTRLQNDDGRLFGRRIERNIEDVRY